jgi:tetratricopeptide (TPR) repeat protein
LTHLHDNEVERFIQSDLTPEERRKVVRHLLTGCRPCRARLMSIQEVLFRAEDLEETARGVGSFSYDAVLARVVPRALRFQARHRKESKLLERAFEAVSQKESDEISNEILVLQGWPRVEALLRLSFEERYRDPQRMLLLAFSARLAAEQLDASVLGLGLVADFQGRAWAEISNAYRVNDQFEMAEAALGQAQRFFDDGAQDTLLLARMADVKASLRMDQRRLGEAVDLLTVVYDLYCWVGDLHLAGRALVKSGIAAHYEGQPREAVSLLRKGLHLLSPERDPRLLAIGRQSLLDAMVACGDFLEAGQILLGGGLRQAFATDPLNLLKLRWVEGKVLAGLGKLSRAERVFGEVKEEFLLRNRDYDAALVGLELAAIWLQQGKVARVQELAEETYEILRDLGIHQEAFKAVLVLREACRQQAVTLGLLRHVHDFLVRLEWNPHLRFEL